jgi:hypothetical protein
MSATLATHIAELERELAQAKDALEKFNVKHGPAPQYAHEKSELAVLTSRVSHVTFALESAQAHASAGA